MDLLLIYDLIISELDHVNVNCLLGFENYGTMGTKRPGRTLLDTLPNINMTDRKHQPGGKTTRDPSPRPGMTAQSERERDRNQEEEWRREREMEKMRDKTRYKGKDLDPREQYSERDCAPAPTREGEREWREREKRREDDRSRNGRPLSNLETKTVKDIEGKMKKGDTFPRMRKDGYTGKDEGRGGARQVDRQRRIEIDDRERERERAWQRDRQRDRERHRERERDGTRSRAKEVEDGRVQRRERRRETDPGFQERRRERDMGVSDLWDRRERDATRKREKLRPDVGKKKARFPSPFRRRDRENYSDREDKGKARRGEERRDTKSEGDTDETEMRRERARDREREEEIYQHSRSEGDTKRETAREKDRNRQRYREEDRPRYRERDADRSKLQSDGRKRGAEKDRERYRDNDRRPERDEERWKDRHDDKAWPADRREVGRHGERAYEERRGREGRGREAEPKCNDATGRSSRPLSETTSRVPPRAQSSGEWSSDMDSERRYRQGRGSYEERESGRDGTNQSERDVEEQRSSDRAAERRRKEQKRSERPGRQRGEGRRMWLEPQRGKNSKESSLEDEFIETETSKRQRERREEERSMESQGVGEGWRVKEEQDERYLDKSNTRGRHYDTQTHGRQEYKDQRGEAGRETEGVSLGEEEVGEARRERDKAGEEHLSDSDGGVEGSWFRDRKRENATDNTEESDTEEEEGSDYYARCESEGGSEAGLERDKMLSAGDSFATVSSGGDGEDEREEEEFQDSREFLEGGVPPVGFKEHEGDEERRGRKEERVEEDGEGKEKHSKYVYCVIGQTLPRSKSNQMSQLDQMGGADINNPNLESSYGGDDITQRPQRDLHLTVRGNDEYRTNNSNNKTTEAKEERIISDETSRVDIRYGVSSQGHDTETGKRSEVKVEHPYAEIGPIKRDSQTEKLLIEWRERNKELAERKGGGLLSSPGNPCAETQDPLDGIDTSTMTPEEEEAIRIRMSGAWSMSEEPKRHSQAPHLKWAKNVVCEILGSSDEHTVDDPNSGSEVDQRVNRSKAAIEKDKQGEESTEGIGEMPVYASVQKPRKDEEPTEPGLDEEEPEPLEEEVEVEVEGLRGMGQSQADMHAVEFTAIHDDTSTYTHADTLLDSEREEDHCAVTDNKPEPSGHHQFEKAANNTEVKIVEETGNEVTEMEREASKGKELEGYLSVSNTLYKPNSCPSLNYEAESDLPIPSIEVHVQKEDVRMGQSEEEKQGEEPGETGTAEVEGEVSLVKGADEEERGVGGGFVKSSCSFRDLGPEARLRRRGIRKTTERRKEDRVEEEEEEAVGRDRRARVFSTSGKESRWRMESLGISSNHLPNVSFLITK